MRIMFAVATYWPFQDGVSQVTRYLAEGLAKKGHEVLVYTGTGNLKAHNLARREVHEGVEIVRIDVFVRWPLTIRGRNRESTPRAYFEKVRDWKPDVLIAVCAQTWPLDWLVPYLDRIACKKVFFSHGYSHLQKHYRIREELHNRNVLGAWIEYRKKRYYGTLYRVVGKFDLALYLLEENNACRYAKHHGLQNGKVLENAVEDVFFSDRMRHEKREKREICFLYVANYNENKNQGMVLQAFVKASMDKASLVFVGSQENAYLERLRREAGAGREGCPDAGQAIRIPGKGEKQVIFCVGLTRQEIYERYQKADVFVCGSRSENAPIVHREAAAAGMAVVSTPVGSVEKMDGILIVQDAGQMCAAMERLSAHREEVYERGERLRQYILQKKCRIPDKVDWLENQLRLLACAGGGNSCNDVLERV